MNEQHAIKLCIKDHDPRGFDFLFKEYRREAYHHAFGFLGSKAEAEDALQESFARAFASMPALDRLPAFYPWFYAILRNGCLNRIRSRKESESDVEDAPDLRASPLEDVARSEQRQRIWKALDALKPEFREILLQKHLFDASYDEISRLLSIPRGTVMSRLYHARRAFQENYALDSEDLQS